MKIIGTSPRYHVAYTEKDLALFGDIISRAKEMWKQSCDKYRALNGDKGSCVRGAGIVVYINSKFEKQEIIGQYEVTSAQGSLVWEAGVEQAVQFLRDHNLDCFYDYGRMD